MISGVKNPSSFKLPVLFPFFQTRFRSWIFFHTRRIDICDCSCSQRIRIDFCPPLAVVLGTKALTWCVWKKGGCSSGQHYFPGYDRVFMFFFGWTFSAVAGRCENQKSSGRSWRYMKISALAHWEFNGHKCEIYQHLLTACALRFVLRGFGVSTARCCKEDRQGGRSVIWFSFLGQQICSGSSQVGHVWRSW